ncbi:MAG: helix-turn-helix transcriptional regulator [Eubacteriales bacterium]|nr:helix-turn-helix transcriptional regulator [Eubacteriales bacterium]
MTVAEMIKQTRTENNMTQEEYANKFYVSRQTVSSWENGRSMPELQTLIDICNTYHLSLDTLLNQDKKYVKKTSRIQMIYKKLKYIVPVVFVCIGIYMLYFGAWTMRNKAMISEYNQNVLSLGYVREGNVYKLYDGYITYHAGNQALPKLKWDFIYKNLSARYNDGEMIWNINFTAEDDIGYFNFGVNVDSEISGEITADEEISYTKTTGLAKSVLDKNQTQIEDIVKTMNHHWHVIYE